MTRGEKREWIDDIYPSAPGGDDFVGSDPKPI